MSKTELKLPNGVLLNRDIWSISCNLAHSAGVVLCWDDTEEIFARRMLEKIFKKKCAILTVKDLKIACEHGTKANLKQGEDLDLALLDAAHNIRQIWEGLTLEEWQTIVRLVPETSLGIFANKQMGSLAEMLI